MDSRRITAGEGGFTDGTGPDWNGLCGRSLALLIHACLYEWVRGCEPSRQVWEHILARVGGSCAGPAACAASLPGS